MLGGQVEVGLHDPVPQGVPVVLGLGLGLEAAVGPVQRQQEALQDGVHPPHGGAGPRQRRRDQPVALGGVQPLEWGEGGHRRAEVVRRPGGKPRHDGRGGRKQAAASGGVRADGGEPSPPDEPGRGDGAGGGSLGGGPAPPPPPPAPGRRPPPRPPPAGGGGGGGGGPPPPGGPGGGGGRGGGSPGGGPAPPPPCPDPGRRPPHRPRTAGGDGDGGGRPRLLRLLPGVRGPSGGALRYLPVTGVRGGEARGEQAHGGREHQEGEGDQEQEQPGMPVPPSHHPPVAPGRPPRSPRVDGCHGWAIRARRCGTRYWSRFYGVLGDDKAGMGTGARPVFSIIHYPMSNAKT